MTTTTGTNTNTNTNISNNTTITRTNNNNNNSYGQPHEQPLSSSGHGSPNARDTPAVRKKASQTVHSVRQAVNRASHQPAASQLRGGTQTDPHTSQNVTKHKTHKTRNTLPGGSGITPDNKRLVPNNLMLVSIQSGSCTIINVGVKQSL